MVLAPKSYWIVGSIFERGTEDQKDRFLKEGVWEIHNPGDSEKQKVLAMAPGDPIAIKATFVQKHGLPFNNNAQPVSVLRLKARGTVIFNPADGHRVEVTWDADFSERDWYFYTYRATIWQLEIEKEEAQKLIRFVWENEPQDYRWFLDQTYWREKYRSPEIPDDGPSIWIEKSIVKGRPDREYGDHALGSALWSPRKSKSGADIYASMRAVQPGDIVLHLTDNQGFTGISKAAGALDETFEGVAGTEWHGDCYRIALKDFSKLSPPLLREQFLKTEPYATELRELAESNTRNLFFNSKLELNQGAYLTKATPTLISILDRAYVENSGKPLPWIGKVEAARHSPDTPAEPYSVEDVLASSFLERSELEEVLLLWKAKKNLLLQGPPGVGKSFSARSLAYALMEEVAPDRIGFVQFHQSYSYEDFVEGFRPTGKGFELKAGKFVQFCRRAEADPFNSHVFIIDEINRGNLSKVLGELMLLIEADKRGPDWAIHLASSSVTFHVPSNVYLMGLMNTADRSLAVVDYALRRRFAFIDLSSRIRSPKFASHLRANGISAPMVVTLVERISALNDEIVRDTLNLGPGFVIGHSFFCGQPSPSETEAGWFRRIVKTEILPLLREYWFDAPQLVRDWENQLLEGV